MMEQLEVQIGGVKWLVDRPEYFTPAWCMAEVEVASGHELIHQKWVKSEVEMWVPPWKMGDFWQALGNEVKPAFHNSYTCYYVKDDLVRLAQSARFETLCEICQAPYRDWSESRKCWSIIPLPRGRRLYFKRELCSARCEREWRRYLRWAEKERRAIKEAKAALVKVRAYLQREERSDGKQRVKRADAR